MGERHNEVVSEVLASTAVMFVGALDTGKTTTALACARAAVESGKVVGFVDADISNSRVGPPSCVGLKYLRSEADFDALEIADALHFVGAISPNKLVLQQTIATAAMAGRAREESDLVIIDTSSVVSGVVGETLKYH